MILVSAFALTMILFLAIFMIAPFFRSDGSSMDLETIRILFGGLYLISIPIAAKFIKR